MWRKKEMTGMKTRIILVLAKNMPMTIQEIANAVINGGNINRKKCEERCKYHIEDLVGVDGILESFKADRRNRYKIKDSVEVLNGKLVLFARDDNEQTTIYEEYVENVLRTEDDEGNAMYNVDHISMRKKTSS